MSIPSTSSYSHKSLRLFLISRSPLNFFPYKLKEVDEGEEGIYTVEFGEEPLCSKDGRMVVLNGIYQFILREVSPSRDEDLHHLLLQNFFHLDKKPWYPSNASILVMVPDMIEDTVPEESWYSVGTPLDPPNSQSIDDVDAWIFRAIERDGYFGTVYSSNDTKDQHLATLTTQRTKNLAQAAASEAIL